MRDYQQGILFSTRLRRKIFPSGTTIQQAKEEYRPKEGQYVVDESGFRIEGRELDHPLWKYSCKCRLNLIFQYDHTEQAGNYVQSIKQWRSSPGNKDELVEDGKK
eukprot:TRINITY_DN778_c0_g1_i1.p1 TRINITY_DN778_c0_g1~~TRINITY_DN778_c0_g1_i1.p1  ORF type:complete len:105 (-),score=19.35 TRINITY_DN778_c0_g1_i1:81-395(-)